MANWNFDRTQPPPPRIDSEAPQTIFHYRSGSIGFILQMALVVALLLIIGNLYSIAADNWLIWLLILPLVLINVLLAWRLWVTATNHVLLFHEQHMEWRFGSRVLHIPYEKIEKLQMNSRYGLVVYFSEPIHAKKGYRNPLQRWLFPSPVSSISLRDYDEIVIPRFALKDEKHLRKVLNQSAIGAIFMQQAPHLFEDMSIIDYTVHPPERNEF